MARPCREPHRLAARNVVRSPRAMGLFNKAGGSLLIGAGIATVAVRAGQS
jgi:threonine/homoserine/homoserine lactone efflux protein